MVSFSVGSGAHDSRESQLPNFFRSFPGFNYFCPEKKKEEERKKKLKDCQEELERGTIKAKDGDFVDD